MNFRTLKDSGLKFNNLPFINYFSYRNVLQNRAKALSKMVLKNRTFVKKVKNLYISEHMILFKFCQHVVQILSNNVWRDFSLAVSAFAKVALKSSNCKFTAKIRFPIGHFMLPLPMLTLKV